LKINNYVDYVLNDFITENILYGRFEPFVSVVAFRPDMYT